MVPKSNTEAANKAQEAARVILADAGFTAGQTHQTILVPAADYELWLEAAVALQETQQDDQDDRAALIAFLRANYKEKSDQETILRVAQRIRDASKKSGLPVHVLPQEAVEAARPRMGLDVVLAYTAYKAQQFGFTLEAIQAKGQGKRSPRHEALKNARAQIALELHRKGATLKDIGTCLGGRSKGRVHDLIRRAEEDMPDTGVTQATAAERQRYQQFFDQEGSSDGKTSNRKRR